METLETITQKNQTLKDIYCSLVTKDPNLFYYQGDRVLTNREGTVDNYHLTDLGFTEFANNMYPVLYELINLYFSNH